ncbi:MAG: hypothetical protein KDB18_12815, partial [Salinibacterium sp.]|nr:hypothetical protein [Salinibacterium sp.]
ALDHDCDFHVNTSNDAWYDESAERELVHLQTRFRAIETRRSLARVSNTGLSGVIDPLGREVAMLTCDGRHRSVSGQVSARVPVGGPDSALRVFVCRHSGLVLMLLTVLGLLHAAFFKSRPQPGLGEHLFS